MRSSRRSSRCCCCGKRQPSCHPPQRRRSESSSRLLITIRYANTALLAGVLYVFSAKPHARSEPMWRPSPRRPRDGDPPRAPRPRPARTGSHRQRLRPPRCITSDGDARRDDSSDASRNHAKARGGSRRGDCVGRWRRQPQLLPARSSRARQDVVHPQARALRLDARDALRGGRIFPAPAPASRAENLSCRARAELPRTAPRPHDLGRVLEGGYSFSQRFLTDLFPLSSSASPSSFVVHPRSSRLCWSPASCGLDSSRYTTSTATTALLKPTELDESSITQRMGRRRRPSGMSGSEAP